ncbi:MAG: hypothetical protein U0169_24075, partial [Polyangiaceae bacterium]
ETFQFLISTYENRYIFDNFRRNRATFNSASVSGRTQDRYFSKVQGMTKSLALAVGRATDDASTKDPGEYMPLALGASDGFAMFARVLTRPEPGYYKYAGGGTADLKYAKADSFNVLDANYDFTVSAGSGEGRYLHNDYDYSKGYFWSSYQTQVGSFYEKIGAIYFLTEAYNHFVQNNKEDYIDGRFKNLNYSSLYPEQMRRLFAALMQNDPLLYGPSVQVPIGEASKNQVARVIYLPWEKYNAADTTTTAPGYAKGSTVLDPLYGWEEQLPTMIYGMYFGRSTLTMDWVNQMRIFSPDGPEALTIPADEQTRYRDPLSGIVYVARKYGTETVAGKTVQRTSGARMLQYARELAKATYKVKSESASGEVEYERDPVTNEPVCSADAATCATNRASLQGFSGNLDIVRQFGNTFGQGPL